MSTPQQNEFDFSASVETRPKAPPRRVWRVQELVAAIREQVEHDFHNVWVEGEVSGCRKAASGHLYFTLKDEDSQLSAVMFRRQAALLRFNATDGLRVLARGKLSLYDQRGQLQLVAETMEPRGDGSIRLAFEQLYRKLEAEELFAPGRKRPLPAFPRSIGIITSLGGAVIHDIRTIVARRHALLNITIYPALVQGPAAALEAIYGLRYFNESRDVDLIVVARGGGSAEDLACYNDERLARAIAASDIPVLSAIGHETDHTILDFVADASAPTPSAAAELITAQQHQVEVRLALLEQRLSRSSRYQIMRLRERFSRLGVASVLARTRDGFARRQQRLDDYQFRIEAGIATQLQRKTQRALMLESRLLRRSSGQRFGAAKSRVDDLRFRLHAAYGANLRVRAHNVTTLQTRLLRHEPGQQIASLRHRIDDAVRRLRSAVSAALRPPAPKVLALETRLLRQHPEQKLEQLRRRFESSEQRLLRLSTQLSLAALRKLHHTQVRLQALSPLAVLGRGYSLTFDESGKLLKDAAGLAPEQRVTTRLAHGTFESSVTAPASRQKEEL